MLLGGKQADIKQVAVVTRNQNFSRLLSRILADWKFFTVDDISAAKVVFAERGLELPAHDGQVVWLTPLPLSEESFLTVPISLTRLYHLLEIHLFPTPRRHIRVAMETAVDLKVEGDWLEGHLVSLSDRGGRISCVNEIPRGKSLDIEVKLANRIFRMPAEVLYCIPAGDSLSRSQPQIGVIFKPPSDQEFGLLKRFIEKTCIERACAREDIPLNDPCVSWLDVPKEL
ncbi:MAG: hypothetical protein DRH08_03415 [Deltaproteobacteria bacterium]|nr:MAG: hypothetical protein DRH08_03415 [Deltaproteobacteria bacterium]